MIARTRFVLVDDAVERRVRGWLRAAGVVEAERGSTAARTPELVFHGAAPTEVTRLVETLARDGLTRTLVVGIERAATASLDPWQVLDAGAADVLCLADLDDPGAAVAERLERWSRIDALLEEATDRAALIGRGARWTALLREVVEVGHFTDASVLLTGESGTGKELVARLIHDLDGRPGKGELVVVDCTVIVPTLAGSELFGHVRGAFTGALSNRDGAFALADGGTLFLDEVGELPLPLQAELLRVIQEGMYKRVGSDTWRSTDFRLVCATNRDLALEMEAGRFRGDLYHRIAEWRFHLPPLRDRREDIPHLVRHFLRRLLPPDHDARVDDEVARFLADRPYPGNVRELRQLVSRMAKRHVGPGPITAGDIPPGERARPGAVARSGPSTLEEAVAAAVAAGATLAEIKRRSAEAAIEAATRLDGSPVAAARRLGVTARALQLRRAADRMAGDGPETDALADPMDPPASRSTERWSRP